MLPRDYVLEQIHHRETSPVPYCLGWEGDVGERLDAYYGSPVWREKIRQYFAWSGIIDADRGEKIDDVRTRDAFGTIWRHDCRPFKQEEAGLQQPSFDGYHWPEAEYFINEQARPDAVKRLEEHKHLFRLAGIGWGLVERTWTIRGFENVLMDVVAEPDFYQELLDRILTMQLRFVEETLKLPIDAVTFSDDWGDQRGVTIGPERWRKYVKPRVARLYEAVHRAGKLAISHCCGNVADILPDIIEAGLDVLESVQPEAMNPYELKRKWGDKITFWGGMGVQRLVPFGKPEEIKAEIRRLRREMARGGGYILACAKPMQPETPTENAVAVVEAFTEE